MVPAKYNEKVIHTINYKKQDSQTCLSVGHKGKLVHDQYFDFSIFNE